MTKNVPNVSHDDWLERFMAGTSPVQSGVSVFQPRTSASDRKVDERTRLVREMTDAATETRVTTTARLKAARLGKEAEDRAQAALAPAKKKAKPKAVLGPAK